MLNQHSGFLTGAVLHLLAATGCISLNGAAPAPLPAPYGPRHLLGGDCATSWATPDDALTSELKVHPARPTPFNVVDLREHLPLGQCIEALALDRWQDGAWVECAAATSIGNRRLVRLPLKVTAERVGLRITRAGACPALTEWGLYAEP